MTPRPPAQRRSDTLETLRCGGDAWVASANPDGTAHLILLSYSWDGERVTVATTAHSKTGRNLARTRWARMALDLTQDAVIVEGPLDVMAIDADDALAAAHAAAIGFDFLRESATYAFFRLTPARIQAMRSPDEERGKTIMRDGRWLDDPDEPRRIAGEAAHEPIYA